MKALPMANDKDLAALAQTVATMAVSHGFLSPAMRQELAQLSRTVVAKTLQWRLVAPLTTATVKRLRLEGVGVPALSGFFVIGALMDIDVFCEALRDLQDRFVADRPDCDQDHPLMAPLAVAMDFAAAMEPSLDPRHIQALCVHISVQGKVAA